jgi:hypothetical protein
VNFRATAEMKEGQKSTLPTQLGNISLRTGGAVRCDPTNGRIMGGKETAASWSREYEKGWAPSL